MNYEEWAKMSPEEQAEKLKKMQEEADAAMAKLTPEEREKAMAEFERRKAEDEKNQQDLLDAARKVLEEGES